MGCEAPQASLSDAGSCIIEVVVTYRPGGHHLKYRVVIEQDEDGIYVAQVPALPGCISQGQSRDEALNNIKEAIELYIESLEAHNEPVPPPISEEVVEVNV